MQTPAAPAARLVFLDWARIGAFGLLVLYHVGMYYVTWDWHIKSPHAAATIQPLMRLVSPWRLDLLFLVSGVATSFMLLRAGAGRTLPGVRARRLLLPLLFGMLVIVPPQAYLEVVQKYGYGGDYLAFMRLYLAGARDFCASDGKCLILPTWNHLWFLPYLFAYTLVLWLAVRSVPGLPDRAARACERLPAGAALFLLPVLYLVATRVLLARPFPVTHAFAGDWFAHAQFLAMFLLGAVLARAPLVLERMQQLRWIALAVALASWVLLVSGLLPPRGADRSVELARVVAYSLQQWCAIVAVIGFARRHLNHDGPVRRYLTDAVFPVYVLHQTLTILLAWTMIPAQLTPAVEAPLLVVATFVLCLAGYEGVRRVRWLRPLFGLKRRPGEAEGGVAATSAALPR